MPMSLIQKARAGRSRAVAKLGKRPRTPASIIVAPDASSRRRQLEALYPFITRRADGPRHGPAGIAVAA